jgi:hypothetical protein
MARVRIEIAGNLVEIEQVDRTAEELADIAVKTIVDNRPEPRLAMGYASQQLDRRGGWSGVRGQGLSEFDPIEAKGGK